MTTALNGSIPITVTKNPPFTLTALDYEITTVNAIKSGALSEALARVGGTTLGYRVFAGEIIGAPLCLLNIAIQAGTKGVIQATITNTTGTTIGILIGEGLGNLLAPGLGMIPGALIGGVIGTVVGSILTAAANYGWDSLQDKYNLNSHNFLDRMNDIVGGFQQAEAAAPIRRDPIIFDLNGDGIKTTTVANGTYFDHGNDGFAESSAWVDSNDGILAIDTNTNGIIDNGTELVTTLSTYDTNSDGVINSTDTNFANLKILKGDGTLETLATAGIASINLSQTTTNTTDTNGNTQIWTGSYTKTDSTTQSYGDYDFLVNNAYSIATDWVDVSAEIAELPDVSGYGIVDSLHQAIAKDTTGVLQGLVEDFVAETDIGQKRAILTNIIYKWTGADNVSPTSRGASIDGQQLTALEKFMGENFLGVNNTTNPNPQAANILNSAYANLSNYIYAQLASQTYLKPLFDEITMQYDSTTNNITMDLSQVTTAIQDAITENETSGQTLLTEFDRSIKALGLKDSSNYSSLESTFVSLGTDYKFLLDTSDKALIYGTSGDDYLNMHKHKILICQ